MMSDTGAAPRPLLPPEARALAERLAPEIPELAQGMFEYLGTEIPEIGMDAETRNLTLASCEANLEVALSMLRYGIPADRAEAPVAALEHARHMAARGLGIDTNLRFYRLGHAYFWEFWIGALSADVADSARLSAVLREISAFTFAYLDVISTKVSGELLAERDRQERRRTAERDELISTILDGRSIDVAAAERTLGFAFASRHVGFVCWTESDSAELERAAMSFAAALGSSRPLLIAQGGAQLSGWQHLDAGLAPATRLAATAPVALPPGVSVAVGSAAVGDDGFRTTHHEARRAQRCAQLAGPKARAITHFDDVRYVDLLSRDLPAARAFVADELGGLARADDRSATLRDFLRVFLATDGNSTATAATLGLHRNTARQRLTRAEELRGRPVTQHGSELRAALELADTLGDAVLGDH
jgi:DNA-binding PucR family transcriptional regulator